VWGWQAQVQGWQAAQVRGWGLLPHPMAKWWAQVLGFPQVLGTGQQEVWGCPQGVWAPEKEQDLWRRVSLQHTNRYVAQCTKPGSRGRSSNWLASDLVTH
jgi:hypothetical protein